MRVYQERTGWVRSQGQFRKEMKKLQRADEYTRKNLECAEIILADAQRYGGEESLMVQWARLVLEKQKTKPVSETKLVFRSKKAGATSTATSLLRRCYENPLNDYQRELIAAYAAEHGEAWRGRINLYDNDKHLPIIWKWDGELVYNFGARFVIPHFDEQLYELIVLREYAPYTGTRADAKRVDAIFARLEEIGGETLLWN